MNLIATSALVMALLVGCGSDPTESDEYREIEERLAVAEQQLADASELPPIVAEFKSAYESGDLDRVRALYTDDGIFFPTDDVHALYWGDDERRGLWDVDGSEFVRTATLHQGEMLIDRAVQVGDNAVSFAWDWEDFASGTATLHLRDGRIAVAVLSVTQVEIYPAAAGE